MRREQWRTALAAPVGVLALTLAMQSGNLWVFAAVAAGLSGGGAWLLARLMQPSIGAVTTGTVALTGLTAAVCDAYTKGDLPRAKTLPLYVAGSGVGIVPAMNWFTATVDGETVVVLETESDS